MNRSVTFILWLLASPLAAQQLEIRFLNVGQGDAAIVQEGGHTAVIDAGPLSIRAYLKSLHIDTIDLVVASHPHADHIGGMPELLQSHAVRFYLDNGVPYTTAIYRQTLAAVRASGAQYLQATNRTITMGAAQIHVLAPPLSTTINNASVGILVEYGPFRALFTGDSELEELDYWIGAGVIPRVSVVKVSHHGSSNGTSASWIATAHPQVAVISVGAGNSYGHPSPLVVAQWQNAGARVYRTDRDGGVLVIANDDGSFVVTTDRSDPKGIVQFRRFVQDSAPPAITPVEAPSPACCRVCTTGQACGNTCISRAKQCRQPPGCACNAKP
jgi:beta-lactamase superfamily II metal-dependent hydrolase